MTQNLTEITRELRQQAQTLNHAADLLENASNGSGTTTRATVTGNIKTGRTLSPAARRRIAKAQKKRWANWKLVRGGKAKAA